MIHNELTGLIQEKTVLHQLLRRGGLWVKTCFQNLRIPCIEVLTKLLVLLKRDNDSLWLGEISATANSNQDEFSVVAEGRRSLGSKHFIMVLACLTEIASDQMEVFILNTGGSVVCDSRKGRTRWISSTQVIVSENGFAS